MKNPGKYRPGLQTAGLLIAAAAIVLAGCSDGKDKAATQTAARVNKQEITVHQINFVLEQQRGLRAEQTDAASRQVLERLIEQELALQKAAELKVDRDPRVVQQLEVARREIVARAYFEKVGESASKPSAGEVKAYYDANPALFKERRVYQLQELLVAATPEQVPTLRSQLEAAQNVDEFIEYLKKNNFKFASNQAIRTAEQLPLASLPAFAAMKDGHAMLSPTPTGAQVVALMSSRSQPVDEERARPSIEQFLINERKRRIVGDDLKALRNGATVQYMGKFAEGAPGPAASASAPTAADVAASAAQGLDPAPGSDHAASAAAPVHAASAASGIDTSTINKGLGLK